jgi:cold shock protein
MTNTTTGAVMTGTIKRLTDKGFGFITAEGLQKDLFFHSTALVGVTFDELKEGDAVSFEMEDSDKGPKAKNVQRAVATV